jgi:hypothetical protein
MFRLDRNSLKNLKIGILGGGGVQLGPLGSAATNRPIAPAPVDYDGEIGGMIHRITGFSEFVHRPDSK